MGTINRATTNRKRRAPARGHAEHSNQFVMVPVALEKEDLTPDAYRLYCVMLSYIRPDRQQTCCWPSLATLQRRMGKGRRAKSPDGMPRTKDELKDVERPPASMKRVLAARDQLVASGLIEIEARGGQHPSRSGDAFKYLPHDELPYGQTRAEEDDQEIRPFGLHYGRQWTANSTLYRLLLYVTQDPEEPSRSLVVDERGSIARALLGAHSGARTASGHRGDPSSGYPLATGGEPVATGKDSQWLQGGWPVATDKDSHWLSEVDAREADGTEADRAEAEPLKEIKRGGCREGVAGGLVCLGV